MTTPPDLPLNGTLVLDCTRMLPGGILARTLLDLGARVIKVEEPGGGDLLRATPPLVGGVGAGFAALYRGAQSLCLNLKDPPDAARLRTLAKHADVLAESFRPGTMERWDLGYHRLASGNPALVVCSMSSFGASGPHSHEVGHDLNFAALTGALGPSREPCPLPVPLADVGGGLLAASAVLAALLRRARTGRGAFLDQPLAPAPLPFLLWPMAEAAAGGAGLWDRLSAGALPAYRCYRCADGRSVALCALEPKFWTGFLDLVGLPELAGAGLEFGPEGRAAAKRVQEAMGREPSAHWLEMAGERALPLSAVNSLEEAAAAASPIAPFFEATPSPGGGSLRTPGPLVTSLGATPPAPAPALGEHTDAILREFGLS